MAERSADMKWWQKTIVYEVYPKSFLDTIGQGTGTLAGITSKLDYLKSLGVGALWLTPVYRSPMKDNGYDISDYCAIDPRFGSMEDMERLIAEAQKRDIKIVMDLVLNHTSNEHEWFLKSKEGRHNDKADWYIWADANPDGSPPTNWRGIFGGSAWTWCEERQQYYLHSFTEFQPDLNWECEDVRKELFRIAKFWLDKGVGGFRLDAVTYLKKPAYESAEPDALDGLANIHDRISNTPGILDFWREFKHEVMDGTDAFTVAEANGIPLDELHEWVGEDGVFDMLFDFSHMLVPMGGNEVWFVPYDWKLPELKRAISNVQRTLENFGWYPIYFENHDKPRCVNMFFPDDVDTDAAAKMLGLVLMTLRGTPFIYQGQELGMTNVAWPSIDDYDDIWTNDQYYAALREGFSEQEALCAVHSFSRDNARTPMQWDDGPNAGFTTGIPWLPVHQDYWHRNVLAQSQDPRSVLAWYRRIALLRSAYPELISGSYEELLAEDQQLYAFVRTSGEHRSVIVANFSQESASYDPALVEGLTPIISTHGDPIEGMLQPLEAVMYRSGVSVSSNENH